MYTAEAYEEGTFSIVFIAPANADNPVGGRELWRGSTKTHLRDIACKIGVHSTNCKETGDEPEWQVNRLVGAILRKFPGEVCD
jgi:hypothetical protein